MLLLTEAKNEMERFGPNQRSWGVKGRIRLEERFWPDNRRTYRVSHPARSIRGLELRVYKSIWARCKQFWTAPMFVRVTDDIEDPKFIQINQPIPHPQAGMPIDWATMVGPVLDDAGTQMLHPDILGYKNKVAEIDVDIIVDTHTGYLHG